MIWWEARTIPNFRSAAATSASTFPAARRRKCPAPSTSGWRSVRAELRRGITEELAAEAAPTGRRGSQVRRLLQERLSRELLTARPVWPRTARRRRLTRAPLDSFPSPQRLSRDERTQALHPIDQRPRPGRRRRRHRPSLRLELDAAAGDLRHRVGSFGRVPRHPGLRDPVAADARRQRLNAAHAGRSEEHTSELQSLMRISYAVF